MSQNGIRCTQGVGYDAHPNFGGPIDLWQFSAGGIKNLNAQELKTVAGQARRFRKMEIELLLEEKYGN